MQHKILLLFVFLTVSTLNIYSATRTVTNGNNDGPGSLRQLIANSTSGDTIVFASNVDTVALTDSIIINKDITLIGSDMMFCDKVVIQFGSQTNLISRISNAHLTMKNLIIRLLSS